MSKVDTANYAATVASAAKQLRLCSLAVLGGEVAAEEGIISRASLLTRRTDEFEAAKILADVLGLEDASCLLIGSRAKCQERGGPFDKWLAARANAQRTSLDLMITR